MPSLSQENQQLVDQLKAQGFENIYEKGGQIYVASSTAGGTDVNTMMLGSQALANQEQPFNAPTTTGGQGGRGAGRTGHL